MSENVSELNDQPVQRDDRWSRYILSFLKRLKPEKTPHSDPNFLGIIWPFSQVHKKLDTIDEALKRFEERNPPLIEK